MLKHILKGFTKINNICGKIHSAIVLNYVFYLIIWIYSQTYCIVLQCTEWVVCITFTTLKVFWWSFNFIHNKVYSDKCLCDTAKIYLVNYSCLSDRLRKDYFRWEVVRSLPLEMLCSNVHTVRRPFQSLHHFPKRQNIKKKKKKREIKVSFSQHWQLNCNMNTRVRFFLTGGEKTALFNTAVDTYWMNHSVMWFEKSKYNKMCYSADKLFYSPSAYQIVKLH